MTTPFQPTESSARRYHLYVYFKCEPDATSAMLVQQSRLALRLQNAGLAAPRLQHRPCEQNSGSATQTWMEVYDEVELDFCRWLEALPETQAIAELSLQGRHAELFVSASALAAVD